MEPDRIVIANSQFHEYAGSEITTLELAEEFGARGCAVAIASFEFGGEITSLAQDCGFRLIDLAQADLSGELFDLAWIHHPPAYYALFLDCGAKARVTVSSSLSHFEPLESPPIAVSPIRMRLVNSEENLEFSRAHYPDLIPHLEVFPNAAPRQFWEPSQRQAPTTLRSIAIISNHPPKELLQAVKLLRAQSIVVDIYGSAWKATRITPALLDRYSAVITIGKTTQYCLARRLPVFCYDHFGGPGWIVPENIRSAASKNFSGRCTPRKADAEQLVADLADGYVEALRHAEELHRFAEDNYNLQRNLEQLLLSLSDEVTVPPCGTDGVTTANILQRHNAAFVRSRKSQRDQYEDFDARLKGCNAQLADCEAMLAYRETQLTAMISSRSWKITTPLRVVHQLLLKYKSKASRRD